MSELSEIFRQHGAAYRKEYQHRMPACHLKAMKAIEQCRSQKLGGHLFYCEKCKQEHYSYHSCKNRHCPKCQNQVGEEWLKEQLDLLLPIKYFMVTFTLPDAFRKLARKFPKVIYNILFRSSSAALQKLALDPKFIGGKIAMIGILQTWKRDLGYHPHIHYIVPGGGLSQDNNQWISCHSDFLVPVKALSVLFRAKFRDELKKSDIFTLIPKKTWTEKWVTHSEAVGDGEYALKYLAPYLSRVAISNKRILALKDSQVTFEYKEAKSKQYKSKTLPAEEFIRRFLQHILPDRFVKIRYYGFLSPNQRHLLRKVQQLLQVKADEHSKKEKTASFRKEKAGAEEKEIPCPACGNPMKWIKKIPRKSAHPP